MPRYFFHSEDGRVIHDSAGTELADDDAARIEAVRLSSVYLATRPEALWETTRWRMLTTDAGGVVLFAFEVNFSTGSYVTPWRRH